MDIHSGNVRDDIRCRWASSSKGECSGVCQAFPGSTLSGVCGNRLNTEVGKAFCQV